MKTQYLAIALLICMALAFSACTQAPTGKAIGAKINNEDASGEKINKENATGEKTMRIGVILPLTGPSSDAGGYVRDGLLIAKDEINNDPKTNYKIDLIFEDSQYNSEKAVTAIQQLININQVKYVIGDYGSSQTLAIAPIAEQNKIILITPSSQSSKITLAGDYIFRAHVSTEQEAEAFADFALTKLKLTETGIIAINTDYGIDYIKDFSGAFQNSGGTINLVQKFEPTETDFKTILLKSKESGLKTILVVANRKSLGLILKQARELNLDQSFISSSASIGPEMISIAGEAAEGLVYSYPFEIQQDNQRQAGFLEKYAQYNNGEKSIMFAANSYDVLSMLSACFEKVGDDVDQVKKCLYETKDYQGASGVISFDQNGDVTKPISFEKIKNGMYVGYEN